MRSLDCTVVAPAFTLVNHALLNISLNSTTVSTLPHRFGLLHPRLCDQGMASNSEDLADLVKSCFGALRRLCSPGDNVEDPQASKHTTSIANSAWEDELGRLRVWSGNLGAHQRGSSSLSYRLRHAPSIRQELLDTLNVMLGALHDAVRLQEGQQNSDGEPDDEYMRELYDDVVDAIEGLFRLSTTIRSPSQRDQILGRSQIDRSMEPYDRSHVQDVLPKASAMLVERLGLANTQRRANLRYLQRHHEKLAQGLLGNTLDMEAKDGNHDNDVKSRMSGTIATEFVAQVINNQDDDTSSITASTTSYAPSLFASTRRVPSKPKPTTADGRFECPLCFYLIAANSDTAWRKHVLHDLQPYVCLLSDCPHANRLFTSRREWYAHQIQQHAIDEGILAQCPLCPHTLSSLTAEKHPGRHLEDLALFTLPSSLFDDEDEQEGLEDHSDEVVSTSGQKELDTPLNSAQHGTSETGTTKSMPVFNVKAEVLPPLRIRESQYTIRAAHDLRLNSLPLAEMRSGMTTSKPNFIVMSPRMTGCESLAAEQVEKVPPCSGWSNSVSNPDNDQPATISAEFDTAMLKEGMENSASSQAISDTGHKRERTQYIALRRDSNGEKEVNNTLTQRKGKTWQPLRQVITDEVEILTKSKAFAQWSAEQEALREKVRERFTREGMYTPISPIVP